MDEFGDFYDWSDYDYEIDCAYLDAQNLDEDDIDIDIDFREKDIEWVYLNPASRMQIK